MVVMSTLYFEATIVWLGAVRMVAFHSTSGPSGTVPDDLTVARLTLLLVPRFCILFSMACQMLKMLMTSSRLVKVDLQDAAVSVVNQRCHMLLPPGPGLEACKSVYESLVDYAD